MSIFGTGADFTPDRGGCHDSGGDLSRRTSDVDQKPIHLCFLMTVLALGQVLHLILRFSPLNICTADVDTASASDRVAQSLIEHKETFALR